MSNETTDGLCKDCGPTFAAFLEQMAAHNLEQMSENKPTVTCPTCGKIHEYAPAASRAADPRAS